MSGGRFNYTQYKITEAADDLEIAIGKNGTKDDRAFWRSLSPESKREIKKGLKILRKANVYLTRMDWLFSGDDGEESFLARLEEDLKGI